GIKQTISARIVIRKLLGIIRAANPPRETEVQALAQPVQFVRHVAVGAVLSGKEVAVWSPGKVEGVARALCENVSGVAEGIGVVWQEKIRGGGRQTKNLCDQRDYAGVRQAPADSFYL